MRRPLIGAKGFQSSHWSRGTSPRRVMEAHQGRGQCVYVKKERKRRRKGEEIF